MQAVPARFQTGSKILLDQHGEQEAWRILTARAIEEHLAGNVEHLAVTQQVQSKLHNLAGGPRRDIRSTS